MCICFVTPNMKLRKKRIGLENTPTLCLGITLVEILFEQRNWEILSAHEI